MTAASIPQRRRKAAEAEIRVGLEREGLVANQILIELAAMCLVRLRQVEAVVDALDSFMCETQRGGARAHPLLGHERELRTELRLHIAGIRATAARVRRTGPTIMDTLGPPAHWPLPPDTDGLPPRLRRSYAAKAEDLDN